MTDFDTIRSDFPVLKQKYHGKPLAYLDTANSAQKPQAVIDKIHNFYTHHYANIHRGVYELSSNATIEYENVRNIVQSFINAPSPNEIIFTKNATEAINLVAASLAPTLAPDDEILLSEMEHHSNILPWQFLQERIGIKIKVIPILDDGSIDLDAYKKLLTEKVKLVAITHMSNVLGTINPIKRITALAHKHNIPVLVDGCQAIAHLHVDVQDLDCDFYAFSSHKIYGPIGAGVLYGKYEKLLSLSPYQGGGGMVELVSFEKTTFKSPPHRFEAGTPPIVDIIAMGTAIQYLQSIGMHNILPYEAELLQYAEDRLSEVPGLKIIGSPPHKSSVISFVIKNIHSHDITTFADHNGVAIRGGHHCAQPLLKRYNVHSAARASLGIYSNKTDIDQLVESLFNALKIFS